MIPNDPSIEPVDLTPTPSPQSPTPNPQSPIPFFDYSDLFFFIGLCVPCLLIALLLIRAVRIFAPMATPVQLLLVQSVWYFLAFGSVGALFRIRYHRPFWQSLGWRPLSFAGAVGALLAGPLLALSVGLLGSALRTPEIDLPFEQMLGSRGTIVLLGIVVVILGPVAEELAFRGFLMPLLVRSIGAVGGIVVTGVIFGSIHGYEYQWSWRHMLLISTAGCVFGWVRYKTQSTVASAFMHSTFNLTQFAAFLVQAQSI
jgi:membrane protease YdiL (CAAX protease family)